MTSRYKALDKSVRVFKSGQELNIVNFEAPRKQAKDKTNLINRIVKFANMKSKKMTKSPRYKNNRIQLQLLYESGKYISTSFFNIGDVMDFNYESYDDTDIEDFGKLISFNLSFMKVE